MTKETRQTKLSILAAIAAAFCLNTACSGDSFSSGQSTAQVAGSPDAGAGSSSPDGGDPGQAGADTAGSESKGGASAGTAGSASGGEQAQGGSGSSGSGGAAKGGTAGQAQGGTSGGTQPVGGSAGQGGNPGVDYACKLPGPVTEASKACMKRLCGDLKYECGKVEDKCAGDETPCGFDIVGPLDCQLYLGFCPAYTKCGNDHQCGDQCARDVKFQDKCHTADQNAPGTFAYDCGPPENPGVCSPDPKNPNSMICECQNVAGLWCCAKNSDLCSVRFYPVSVVGCDQKPYMYDCMDAPPPGNSCSYAPSIGPNTYCCSNADIE